MQTRNVSELEKREKLLEQALLVVSRLEKLSPDSSWAHRSSGARGALLKAIEQMAPHPLDVEMASVNCAELDHLAKLIQWGFDLLEKGAKELSVSR